MTILSTGYSQGSKCSKIFIKKTSIQCIRFRLNINTFLLFLIVQSYQHIPRTSKLNWRPKREAMSAGNSCINVAVLAHLTTCLSQERRVNI